MTRRTERTARAVAVAALASVVLAACGPDDPEKPTGTGKNASPRASAAPGAGSSGTPEATAPADPAPGDTANPGVPGASKPLTRAELDRAILATADVPGYTVGPMDPPPPQGETPAEEACAPLTALLNGKPEPAAQASAYRQITGANAESRPAVSVFLTTHGNQGAATVLNRLRTAVTACRDGFTTTGPTGPSTYRSVRALPPVKAGDDGLAYQLTADFEGDPVPLVFHVVRSGATVATFYTANLEGPKTPEMPAALITAQAAKLSPR
ncbi:hypothetical protein AB0A69_27855 [Streptomyces sp. NPDC045431]|uniref:hypothetical protein n=1 Tax=Streptomyces sp. NPDC045431 TaxID=3155613 RepID=UPI0033F1EC62